MRVLIVTNMWPAPARPALGAFVRVHVEALRRRRDVEAVDAPECVDLIAHEQAE